MLMKRQWLRQGKIVLLVVGGLFGAYLGGLQLTGNFHEVVAGELYRSNQPSAQRLETYIRDYGIKTVINLRGAEPHLSYYSKEIATANQLGVTHIDFKMSARRELSATRMNELETLLRDAEKPVLIHCKAGADRTGLASALYVATIANQGELKAEMQLTPFYGHLPIPGLGVYAMDNSWEAYEPVMGID